MMSSIRLVYILLMVALLSACKVELYTGLDEKEGNEMLALLLSEGISASKKSGKGNLLTLMVNEGELTEAVNLLTRHSYPRHKYATLDDVFPQGGLIQSPMADAARYNYAMSQDIAETIANIDGVLTARVHLVLPSPEPKNKARRDEPEEIAKASVFIKYNSTVPLEPYVPHIKTMVANAVDNLAYENISVAIFPSLPANGKSG